MFTPYIYRGILKKYSRNKWNVNMEAKDDYSPRVNRANLTTFASLVSGFLLLAVGFFTGWYWQNASVQDVVKVEIVEKGTAPPPPVTLPSAETESNTPPDDPVDCQFVGSKNSDKFHTPDSAPAKRIKPENKVCFASEEEALEEGYEAGTIDE